MARVSFTRCLVSIHTCDPVFHNELIRSFTAVRLAIAVAHQEMKLSILDSVQLRQAIVD
jgi:hypothetical protein